MINLTTRSCKSLKFISYERKNEFESQGTTVTASDRICDEKSIGDNSKTINSISFDETNIEMLPNDIFKLFYTCSSAI